MWHGSFVALVTPFNSKGGIDYKTLQSLVSWQIAEGTEGIVCCATTGEGMTLSEKEREKVLSCCLEVAGNRIPMIVGSGTADTKQSVRLTERMQRVGASGCLIPVPYYNKPTQQGIIRHVEEIAKVGLPLIFYNNPARTLKAQIETVVEVAKIPGVVAYKDSTGDLEFITQVKALTSIPIFSGDDHLTYATLQAGGSGAISVIGNLFPRQWKTMIQAALCKEWVTAQTIFERLAPIYQVLFLETNPQCVKFGMNLLGKCGIDLRLPLLPPTPSNQSKVKEALDLYCRH